MLNNESNVKVDIILPNYNSAKYLSETIDSIINQTFKNWKLIIIDDHSNLETKEILKRYEDHPNIKIKWLAKNKKTGFCRNLAMRNSSSDYIAFIDSDDIWDEQKIHKQLEFMIKNKYHFTYTNYNSFKLENKKNLREVIPPRTLNFKEFIKNTSIATSTMMIKKSLIGNTKFSNTKICEDYFFKCKILKKIEYAYSLPENLMSYRISKNSLQSNKLKNLYWIWLINRKYNKLSFFENLVSVVSISINSIKKYGFK
jgi:teichuronic acid biosynthesis glycosyltransferase TuaG